MNFNFRKKVWMMPVFIINIFLIENVAKIYEFNFASDNIRLICYALLGSISIIYIPIQLYKKKGKVNKRSIGLAIVIYTFVLLCILYYHNNIIVEIFLVCFMIPFSLILSYFASGDYNELDKVINIQAMVFCIIWIMYMYNKFFLYQAGAGKINSIFYLVLLLPFILCMNNSIIKKILIMLLIIASVISLKRTAIIMFILGLIAYIWNKDKNDFVRVFHLIGILVVGLGCAIWIQNKMNINMFGKFAMVIEDGGSGRLEIYSVLMKNLFIRDIKSIVIGEGYYGVIDVIGGTAHNDFLEILYDFGLIGFAAYINLYITLIKNYILMQQKNYIYSGQFLTSILIFVFMSIFSHVIMIPTYMMFICLFWGLVLNHFNNYLLLEKEILERR